MAQSDHAETGLYNRPGQNAKTAQEGKAAEFFARSRSAVPAAREKGCRKTFILQQPP